MLDVESLLSGDKYSFVKDAYIQSMNYEIADGIDVQDDFIDDMEDFLIDYKIFKFIFMIFQTIISDNFQNFYSKRLSIFISSR